MIKIGLDAMGGDYAPKVTVGAVVQCASEFPEDAILLIGDKGKIEDEFRSQGKLVPENVEIVHAAEVIRMDEPAALSVRRKKDSSIVRGAEMLRDGDIDAFVSAGHTGAIVCAATLKCRLLDGIERPGLAIVFPTKKGASLLIDVGANIEAKPTHILGYAVMAKVYCEELWQMNSPTVGLLNIGEEDIKGKTYHKEAFKLLQESGLNFKGNVEAKHIFSGKTDIIVTDGLTGNIALKIAESVADFVSFLIKKEVRASIMSKLGALFLAPAFARVKRQVHYSEYGGALLMGLNGICIIGHGISNATAIANAVRLAAKEVKSRLNERTAEELSKLRAKGLL